MASNRTALTAGGLELGTTAQTRVVVSATADGEVKMVDSSGTNSVAMSNVRVKHIISSAVTSNTILTFAHDTVQVDTTNGPVTLTLPSSDATMAGRTLHIMDTGGHSGENNITVNPYTGSGNTISGYTSLVLNHDNAMVTLDSNGTGKWFAQFAV